MPGMRLIAGSGRSGTTWVLDALATANKMRPVFEPLHPHVSMIGERYGHRALAPDELHPELQVFLEEVCAGYQERLWTQYRCQRHFLVPSPAELRTITEVKELAHRWRKFLKEAPGLAMMSTRREPLVKCIWANLMLGWLSQQCNFRIVLVVRHPGAVTESELRNAWSAKLALDRFRGDTRLHEMTNGRYLDLLKQKLTPIEELAAQWLIENQWAIETAPANGVTVVFFERLKSLRDSEWEQIQRAFDLPCMPDAAMLARPSQQTASQGSEIDASATGRPRWQRVLTYEQMSQVQRILDQAHFDLYSMADTEPREGSLDAALAGTAGRAG
jgi:hypothetical protein